MGYAEQERLVSKDPDKLKELKEKAEKALKMFDHLDNEERLFYFSSMYEGEKTDKKLNVIKEALEAAKNL